MRFSTRSFDLNFARLQQDLSEKRQRIPEGANMFEDDKEKSSSITWDLSSPWVREADLLWAVKDGFSHRYREAFSNEETSLLGVEMPQYVATDLKAVAAGAVGAGLRIMSGAGGPWGGISKAVMVTGAFGFGCDVLVRTGKSVVAGFDTWKSKDNHEESRKVVAENIGSALFDYPVLAAGGYMGAKAPELGLNFNYLGVQRGFASMSRSLGESPVTTRLQSVAEGLGFAKGNAKAARAANASSVRGAEPAHELNLHNADELDLVVRKPDPAVYKAALKLLEKPATPYKIKFAEYDGHPVAVKVYPPGKAEGVTSSAQMGKAPGISLGGFGRRQITVSQRD